MTTPYRKAAPRESLQVQREPVQWLRIGVAILLGGLVILLINIVISAAHAVTTWHGVFGVLNYFAATMGTSMAIGVCLAVMVKSDVVNRLPSTNGVIHGTHNQVS